MTHEHLTKLLTAAEAISAAAQQYETNLRNALTEYKYKWQIDDYFLPLQQTLEHREKIITEENERIIFKILNNRAD